jgi:hypothetical protein
MWIADLSTGFYIAGITDYPVDINTQRELDLDRDNPFPWPPSPSIEAIP